MVSVLIAAAAVAAASPQAMPAAPVDDPALFMVRDADTTVYIFGTFHALDGRSEWFNDDVRNAFERSGELVLETLVPEGPAKPAPAFTAATAFSSMAFASARVPKLAFWAYAAVDAIATAAVTPIVR